MVILLDECRTEFIASSRQYVKRLPISDLEKTIWKAIKENRKRVILCNENFRKNINIYYTKYMEIRTFST